MLPTLHKPVKLKESDMLVTQSRTKKMYAIQPNNNKRVSPSNKSASFRDYRQFLEVEARALLTRLSQVKSFALTMHMVPAANISIPAQRAIHKVLKEGVKDMELKVNAFIQVIQNRSKLEPASAQKAFAILKLKFNWLLDSLDIYSDVMTLRGEHDTGILLAGMDALGEDTLRLNKAYYESPPLITYLDRGHGAAIRRARTRLPGGKSNPVAVIRVPRERMISTGIASSLVHEVGHQGASLLGLIGPLKKILKAQATKDLQNKKLWDWYGRWISEILSDFWSVSMIGIGSTTGLINVVSVPSYFVFRLNDDAPHPPPWIRVRLSIVFGAALYPDPQWDRLKKLWDNLYPLRLAGTQKGKVFEQLEKLLKKFVLIVLTYRPSSLKGQMLKSVFPLSDRQPQRLRLLFKNWSKSKSFVRQARPSLVFAIIGQARADGKITPKQENELLSKMLRTWAVQKNIH